MTDIKITDNLTSSVTAIKKVFGDYLNNEKVDVDAIIDYCIENDWEYWKSFWERVKKGEIENPLLN